MLSDSAVVLTESANCRNRWSAAYNESARGPSPYITLEIYSRVSLEASACSLLLSVGDGCCQVIVISLCRFWFSARSVEPGFDQSNFDDIDQQHIHHGVKRLIHLKPRCVILGQSDGPGRQLTCAGLQDHSLLDFYRPCRSAAVPATRADPIAQIGSNLHRHIHYSDIAGPVLAVLCIEVCVAGRLPGHVARDQPAPLLGWRRSQGYHLPTCVVIGVREAVGRQAACLS